MTKYTRTEKYDRSFIEENWMGPHPLKLLEALCEKLYLKPAMKVLDMGCGKGLTSIFLAKEFGVTVFANDLWIDPTENLKRFEKMGVADRVFPFHADANALPYANDFFDAAISIDSYHYYGANKTYLPNVFAKLVKKGGQLGIVCPGTKTELNGVLPDTLKGVWNDKMDSFSTFRTVGWWKNLWEESGLVKITGSGNLEDAKEVWSEWADWSKVNLGFGDKELLAADKNDDLTIIYLTALKK